MNMDNIKKQLIKLMNEENQQIIIGFLTILIFLWLILYIIPDILNNLFNTFLGNLILLLGIILLGSKDIKYSLLALLVIVLLYRFSQLNTKTKTTITEGFTWSPKSIANFTKLQQSINPHVVFDTNKIQKQASQKEVDYFLQNKMWPWSKAVQNLYRESVLNNKYVQINPDDAVNQARQIYNQAIILEIISWQKKEGQLLLNGITINSSPNNTNTDGVGTYAYSSGLISNENNPNVKIIKCKSDASGNYSLSQKQNGIKQVYTKVNSSDLENIIPGFKFVSQPCDPCVALNSPPGYTCPFTLDISSNHQNLFSNNISKVWQYLWGINTDPLQSVPSSFNQNNPNPNPNNFPILAQLQTELNGIFTTEKNPQTKLPPTEPTTKTSMSASKL